MGGEFSHCSGPLQALQWGLDLCLGWWQIVGDNQDPATLVGTPPFLLLQQILLVSFAVALATWGLLRHNREGVPDLGMDMPVVPTVTSSLCLEQKRSGRSPSPGP